MTVGTAVRTISQAERDPSKITTTIRQLSDLVSGQGMLANGGTGADLSATGGTSQVLKQTTLGGPVTVGQLAASDLSNGTTGTAGTAVVLKTSAALTTPNIGAATGTSLAATGSITSSGGGVGYATGAGGTVTQTTSRTTPVTINKLSGDITLIAAVINAAGNSYITVNNSLFAATDNVILNQTNSSTVSVFYDLHLDAPTNGQFSFYVRNTSPTNSSSEQPIIRFTIIKSVNA